MKTINVILVIIFIIAVSSCKNYDGFERTELKQNYLYVDYLIKNADSLYIIFHDTLKVHENRSIDEKRILYSSNLLKEHIIENKIQDGYDFVMMNTKVYDNRKENYSFLHLIKIRSKHDQDIPWFEFIKETNSPWKLLSFYFCNNYRGRGILWPFDKSKD